MKHTTVEVRESPISITDSGRVRVGAVSPAFPPVRGKPVNANDTAKVRIGAVSPAFPPARTK
jgi:hypothetical protein